MAGALGRGTRKPSGPTELIAVAKGLVIRMERASLAVVIAEAQILESSLALGDNHPYGNND